MAILMLTNQSHPMLLILHETIYGHAKRCVWNNWTINLHDVSIYVSYCHDPEGPFTFDDNDPELL